MTNYTACCCYSYEPCEVPFTIAASGRIEYTTSIAAGVFPTTRYIQEVSWELIVDDSLPFDAIKWRLNSTNRKIVTPGALDASNYEISTTISSEGVRLNHSCTYGQAFPCENFEPPIEYGLRIIEPIMPFHVNLDTIDWPNPEDERAGTTTGTLSISGTLSDGSPATVQTLGLGPYGTGEINGPQYYTIEHRVYSHYAFDCRDFSTNPPTPHFVNAQFFVPFDGPTGTPNPMGSEPFAVMSRPPFGVPTANVGCRPVRVFSEDGGVAGGVPFILHPFQGFECPVVDCGGFPQKFAAWFCQGDSYPLTGGFEIVDYQQQIDVS